MTNQLFTGSQSSFYLVISMNGIQTLIYELNSLANLKKEQKKLRNMVI